MNYPDPIPSDEFRNFTFLPDIRCLRARGTPPVAVAAELRGRLVAKQPWGSTGCPPNQKVEIDWVCPLGSAEGVGQRAQNEWDKLFPPDLSIPELNPPDYRQ